MAKQKHEHSALIDEVGAAVVRGRFGLKAQRLHMWRVRGIPHLRRMAFAKLAAEHGIVPPADFMERLTA